MPDAGTAGPDHKAALQRLAGLDDADIDLANAALHLAGRDRPGVSLARYREHLAELADAVSGAFAESADSLAARRHALVDTIHGAFGYTGDRQTYDDLQNASLMRVIDRRKGLPIALGILHIHCGRARGWDICGLNFPGHFLIRIELAGSRMILDPFNGGAEVTVSDLRDLLKATHGADAELAPEHYAPAGNREILIRLQNNRKIRLLKANQVADGLAAVEDMLLFAPGEPSLWHEAGVLNAHLGNLRAALMSFEHCHDLTDSPADRARVAGLIRDIRGRMN
ncbi:MAG: transglutaminase family protein [Alphaproteobacteria bacterium]|nr:transglutaminase family protein [Alphaproteobacteria bacterium]